MRIRSMLLGAGAALLLSAGAASAANITTSLNLRSGPGTRYAVVEAMPAGAQVAVLSCNGAWCRVNWNGEVGYASASFITGVGYARNEYYSAPDNGYYSAQEEQYGYYPDYAYDEGYYPDYGYDYGYGPGIVFGFGGRSHGHHHFRGDHHHHFSGGNPGPGISHHNNALNFNGGRPGTIYHGNNGMKAMGAAPSAASRGTVGMGGGGGGNFSHSGGSGPSGGGGRSGGGGGGNGHNH